MKKKLAICLAMVFLALSLVACAGGSDSLSAVKSKGTLTIATSPDFPPFESLDNEGNVVGIEIDLLNKVCDELGVALDIQQMDFDSVLPGVQAGKYDLGVSGISVTEERLKNSLFTDAYCLAAQAIVVTSDSPVTCKADLDGKAIAVQTGTTAESYCSDNGYTVNSYAANSDAELALVKGKVDAWVIDDLTAADMVKAYNADHADQLVILSEAMTTEPYAFALSLDSDTLCEEINSVLNKLVADGTVADLFEKYGAPYTAPELQADQVNTSAHTPWLTKLRATIIDSGGYKQLLDGLKNTVIITLGALCIGVIIGTLIAVIKYFGEDIKPLRPLVWLCDLYVTAIRGIPVVVLLLIFYFVILTSADGIVVGILTFGINSGAYMAELIRSGIGAVDPGQMEAGRSLGMSKLQAMKVVVFPQAVRYILPAIGNELIALLKEPAVAGYVAVVDLTRAGNLIRNNTYDAVNPLMVVALTYLIMVVILTQLLGLVEKRLSKSDKR